MFALKRLIHMALAGPTNPSAIRKHRNVLHHHQVHNPSRLFATITSAANSNADDDPVVGAIPTTADPQQQPNTNSRTTTDRVPRRMTTRATRFVTTLCSTLKCPTRVAQHIVVDQPELLDHSANIRPVCRLLLADSITVDSIIENAFVLASPAAILAEKLALLRQQRPRDLNDFVPLLRASVARLNKMRRQMLRESAQIPGGHRVYYLSERLKLEPHIVAQHLSTHLFMFDLPVEQLVLNLDVQLRYNVAPINILRDPWAFRYSQRSIEARLDRATEGQKDKLMPWMVRCPETILAKSIQHSVDEKALLGDRTLVDYVAERLGFDVVTTKYVLDKHPQIYTVRITKIKEVLDYFLLGTEFNANDVAQVPRILCHSLQTTRNRLDELRAIGCKPTSLVIVCKSANEYRKFVEKWTSEN